MEFKFNSGTTEVPEETVLKMKHQLLAGLTKTAKKKIALINMSYREWQDNCGGVTHYKWSATSTDYCNCSSLYTCNYSGWGCEMSWPCDRHSGEMTREEAFGQTSWYDIGRAIAAKPKLRKLFKSDQNGSWEKLNRAISRLPRSISYILDGGVREYQQPDEGGYSSYALIAKCGAEVVITPYFSESTRSFDTCRAQGCPLCDYFGTDGSSLRYAMEAIQRGNNLGQQVLDLLQEQAREEEEKEEKFFFYSAFYNVAECEGYVERVDCRSDYCLSGDYIQHPDRSMVHVGDYETRQQAEDAVEADCMNCHTPACGKDLRQARWACHEWGSGDAHTHVCFKTEGAWRSASPKEEKWLAERTWFCKPGSPTLPAGNVVKHFDRAPGLYHDYFDDSFWPAWPE